MPSRVCPNAFTFDLRSFDGPALGSSRALKLERAARAVDCHRCSCKFSEVGGSETSADASTLSHRRRATRTETTAAERRRCTVRRCGGVEAAFSSHWHTNNASAEEPGLESEGRMLHVTERLEDSHHRLNIHPQNPDILSRAQMQDLYEGFAGQFTVSPDSGKEHGRQHLQGHSALWPQVSTVLSHLLCFNQCGFADPEYIVNLTVKSPSWMSGRFLISCPSTAEASPSPFSVPPVDNVESGYGVRAGRERRSKSLTLKNIYRHLAQAHSKSSCRYVFTPEAVLELRRFQEEEWSTIMAQLNTGDHSGVISKSLGHVVRLAGVLKALSEAATLATKGLSRDYAKNLCMEEEEPSEEKEVEIGIDDIARALELGKYFLEQKMSMTFMFSPGFFRNCSTSSQNSQQDQQDMRTTAAAAQWQWRQPARQPSDD
ncbi:uncharacterized protein LOC112557257 [Pomacea canaliculata]|uniref:uncharacterized protein LOC112557257 n=1 Tax=Pomacea canaliculata TaxID=400727 RepID=UPI000D73911D|nr:uncharacterized protein LOC112557257 [Pomacea canaliculata]XP_025082797.1 uncharacterized protein LOC112557257 [Pomacea canaliculata]XP_025082806.1 uncharacterized protein LOC112557257 [Pomacea canaliculata]